MALNLWCYQVVQASWHRPGDLHLAPLHLSAHRDKPSSLLSGGQVVPAMAAHLSSSQLCVTLPGDAHLGCCSGSLRQYSSAQRGRANH